MFHNLALVVLKIQDSFQDQLGVNQILDTYGIKERVHKLSRLVKMTIGPNHQAILILLYL